VSQEAFDQFLELLKGGSDDLPPLTWAVSTPSERRVELITNLSEAFRLSRNAAEAVEPDAEERRNADVAREKLCLREISAKYKKIVQRWEPLEALRLHEPLLEEATRAYLYGFYRATVVLSASALEDWLKRLTRTEWLESYDLLVDRGLEQGILDKDRANWASGVFKERNRAAHEHSAPDHEVAKEVLYITRKLLGGSE
jgi:hypothetical protein